jgi:putative endonuclease
MFFVYVLVSEKDGSTYIGYTNDIEKRLLEHNSGKTKSLQSKLPMKLVYSESFETKTEAIKRERQLKNSSWHKNELFNRIFG